MDLLADGLLIVGALAAAFYCWILARRIKRLKELDTGVGGAIAALSSRVDDMQTALKTTQSVTDASVGNLEKTTRRAEKVARRLEGFLDEIDGLDLQATKADLLQQKQAKASSLANRSADGHQYQQRFADRAQQEVSRSPASEQPVATRPMPEQQERSAIRTDPSTVAPLQFQRRRPSQKDEDNSASAQRLQEDIRQRLLERANDADTDQLVSALEAALSKRVG